MRLTALAAGCLCLAACASPKSPPETALALTRAVYANDLDALASQLDDATKPTVRRAELGALSDRMHALGDLRSVTQRAASPDTGRYEFDAAFGRGAMRIFLRLDPDGKVGAYRAQTEPRAR